jgi:MFS family permease
MTVDGRPGGERDFRLYLVGQAISAFGSSFTSLALPLLVYDLTSSAASVGLSVAISFLPYLLFGLPIGAITDRIDRKRMMITCDLLQAGLLIVLPLLWWAGALSAVHVYAFCFVETTAQIFFEAGSAAGVAQLVPAERLLVANGRVQASATTAAILGPVAAGVLLAWIPIVGILLLDGITFGVSALTLSLIRRSFTAEGLSDVPGRRPPLGRLARLVLDDVREGLTFVWHHPVLRDIAVMMAAVNFFGATLTVQLVVYVREHLGGSDSAFGYVNAAGAVGVVVVSLLAAPLRRRFPLGAVLLGTPIALGGLAVMMGATHTYLAGLVLWALYSGLLVLFNLNTRTLRQQLVPDRLIGRVVTTSSVLAWSAIPLGSVLGGVAVARLGIGPVFVFVGVAIVLIATMFRRSSLTRADGYLTRAPAG